jgi:hypothetical protein
MARHVFIIVNDPPAADQLDAFENWYVARHMPDVLDVPGFVAAQRYRLPADPAKPEAPPKHLTIYEIETDDRSAVMAELRRRAGTDQMPLFSGPDRGATLVFLGEAATPRLLSKNGSG